MEDTRSLAEWMKVVGGDIRATEIEQTTHMPTGRIGLQMFHVVVVNAVFNISIC